MPTRSRAGRGARILRHAPVLTLLVWVATGSACREQPAGPTAPEPIRPTGVVASSARPPSPSLSPPPTDSGTGIAAADEVIGRAQAKRGDFVDYQVRSHHASRFSDGWKAEGGVRVWILEASSAESRVLLHPLGGAGAPLVVRVAARKEPVGRLVLLEDRTVGGRTFSVAQQVVDRGPSDGPKTTTTFALGAPELAAVEGVLLRHESVGGRGGFGSTNLEAVGFGNETPPSEVPAGTVDAADPLELLTHVLPRQTVPKLQH